MMKHKNLTFAFIKDERGIGLVETLAALAISVIVVTALVSLAVFTLRASLQSKLQLKGSEWADGEIELVRAYRDTNNWATFSGTMDGCTVSCYITPSLSPSSGKETDAPGTAQEISRYFVAEQIDTNVYRINVTVEWVIGGITKYAHISTDLSNWRDN